MIGALATLVLAGCSASDPAQPGSTTGGKDEIYRGKTIRQWIELLQNKDLQTANEATSTLVSIGRPAIPGLVEVLEKREPTVCFKAAIILGRMGPEAKSAVPALVKTMPDKKSQHSVIVALGEIGPDAAEAIQATSLTFPLPTDSFAWTRKVRMPCICFSWPCSTQTATCV